MEAVISSIKIKSKNKTALLEGMKDGLPIGLGYFAVAFSLGIAAKNAGLSPFQAFLTSLLCNASAGEYIGFTLIAANAPYLELIIITFITNARYMLMSCALSQRVNPKTKLGHRLLLSFYITDEFFATAVSKPGYVNPYYTYGAVLCAAPLWAIGTFLGTLAGSILPLRVVSALSVALYGMFLAVIIPPAKENKIIAGIIALCFASSFAANYLPFISEISSGGRTIILTILISSLAAILFPKKDKEQKYE